MRWTRRDGDQRLLTSTPLQSHHNVLYGVVVGSDRKTHHRPLKTKSKSPPRRTSKQLTRARSTLVISWAHADAHRSPLPLDRTSETDNRYKQFRLSATLIFGYDFSKNCILVLAAFPVKYPEFGYRADRVA